jgi:hypothetical protein
MDVRGRVEKGVNATDGAAQPRKLELPRDELDPEMLELYRRCRESEQRSRERRATAHVDPRAPSRFAALGRIPWAILVVVATGVFAALAAPLDDVHRATRPAAVASVAPGLAAADLRPPSPASVERQLPGHRALGAARDFAAGREGVVSFAVIDTRGRLHGSSAGRRYVSASVVKSMLLAAELRRLRQASAPMDPATAATLRAMITYSDNAAADTIYSRVGDEGLYAIARAAGMEGFDVYGYWANAQITAADMARMFAGLDPLMRGPHREFALGLLGSVIPEQSWGIPAAAGARWAVRFKGGWRSTDLGQLVHQVAELRDGDRKLAIAVLTDGQPTQAYGIETVRGIAERLLPR